MSYQYVPGRTRFWPGYLYAPGTPIPASEKPTIPCPAPAAPAVAPPSRECPCGIHRADCEYHRCP